MLSGYLPEKTGVYSFGKWDPDGKETVESPVRFGPPSGYPMIMSF